MSYKEINCMYCCQSWQCSENWKNAIPKEKRHNFTDCKLCVKSGGNIDPRKGYE